jgi:hypothetical protein
MASNTKLTPMEKQDLREFKRDMAKNMAFGQSGRVTVLAQITGNVVRFSTAVASPDEQKIRRKVGQYHALCRWDVEQFAVMPVPPTFTGEKASPDYVASLIADTLDNM